MKCDKKNCLTCKWFASFRDDYNDKLKSANQGFCCNDESKYYYNAGTGDRKICGFYTAVDKKGEVDEMDLDCDCVKYHRCNC